MKVMITLHRMSLSPPPTKKECKDYFPLSFICDQCIQFRQFRNCENAIVYDKGISGVTVVNPSIQTYGIVGIYYSFDMLSGTDLILFNVAYLLAD